MAVITRARTSTEANYRTLTPEEKDRFDQLMERADHAGPHDYQPLMDALAVLTGVTGEIRKCACSCTCPAIFDADNADVHVIEYGEGYNLGRHQCPWCADQHRETA
ncbi:hypothetical protein DMH12_36185 [Streptomyces sp. WAC 04229]|uniref:hypothetical protein n=1 Tax=Streptomyces sp. WAC 04229 TaxID=2203206 RepID=UPI000F747F4B|nr:hypothetical protein [Streptomyces sp. WAC 04229]RSN39996.1 hypothetical protein DMH12_36185 [Streptomyces sp. WAC 04229]